MKYLYCFAVCSLLCACGDVFEASTSQGSVGVGGGSTGSNSTGGMTTKSETGGETNSTTTLSISTTVTYQSYDKSVNGSCDGGNFVYVPDPGWSGGLTVSCYKPSSYPVKIHSFAYQLFNGTYKSYGCKSNSHRAFWFVTQDNQTHQLPLDPNISYKTLNVNDDAKTDKVNMPDWNGDIDTFTVNLDNFGGGASLVDNDLFCFGHKFVFVQGQPTCPVACYTSQLLDYHQLSTNAIAPFNFFPLKDVPGAPLNANFISFVSVEFVN